MLNSKLIKFYVKELLHDGLHFYPDQQKQLPIPKLDSSNQHLCEQITQKVKPIMTAHDKEPLQNEIDSLVYKLYNLSDDEITTIDSKT